MAAAAVLPALQQPAHGVLQLQAGLRPGFLPSFPPSLGRRGGLAVDSSAASLGLCCRRGRRDAAAVCVALGAALLF